MTTRCGTSWPHRRGLTLIEALAGTALLGSVLAAILVANGRLATQAARAARREEACRVADDLMEHLWRKKADFPRDKAGDVPRHAGWTWRTRVVADGAAEALRAERIAVEVFRAAGELEPPTARVEILLAAESHDETNGTDAD